MSFAIEKCLAPLFFHFCCCSIFQPRCLHAAMARRSRVLGEDDGKGDRNREKVTERIVTPKFPSA